LQPEAERSKFMEVRTRSISGHNVHPLPFIANLAN